MLPRRSKRFRVVILTFGSVRRGVDGSTTVLCSSFPVIVRPGRGLDASICLYVEDLPRRHVDM